MPSNRDKIAAVCATALVVSGVILGFLNLGGPSVQRQIQADKTRVEDLTAVCYQVNSFWSAHDKVLPSATEVRVFDRKDPVSRLAYEYRALAGSRYELCATFAQDNRQEVNPRGSYFWQHAQGHQCFDFDAAHQNVISE